jgi:hypothetical protein
MAWLHVTKAAKMALAAVFLALAGCDASSEGSNASTANSVDSSDTKKTGTKPKTFFDTLSATSIVVRVDGEEITKADVLAWWDARVQMYLAGRSLTNAREAKRFKDSVRDRSLAELVRNAMIRSYANKKGITPRPERVKASEKRIMSELHKPKSSFRSFANSMKPATGAMFVKMIHADALSEAVIETLSTNDLYNVTEEEFTNRVEFIRVTNERTDATNKIVRAKAWNARQEILNGAYFADVAKKYADFNPEEGEKWQQVQLDEFDGDHPLCTWLAKSEVGAISEPMDLEDGISIVGLKMKYPGETAPDGSKTLDTYEIVRCAFHAFDRVEDYGGDRASIVKEMLEERRKDAMLVLRGILEKECKIEFPNGNDLFKTLGKNPKKKKGKADGKPKTTEKQSQEKAKE